MHERDMPLSSLSQTVNVASDTVNAVLFENEGASHASLILRDTVNASFRRHSSERMLSVPRVREPLSRSLSLFFLFADSLSLSLASALPSLTHTLSLFPSL